MNEIWMIDHKTIRCHTTIERLKGKLSNYTGAIVTNVYFKHERRTAWDIDISIEKRAAAEKLLRCKTQTNTYDITGHASYQYDPYLSAQKRHHGNEERVLIPGAISKHPPEQFTINSVHYELVSSSGQFCVYALTYPPEIKIIGYDIWEHIGRYIYWCESWDKKESTIKRIEAMTTAGRKAA